MPDVTRQKATAQVTADARKADFVEKANQVHNNFYDYSKVDYINARTKVIIICPLHGEFEQMPFNHLKGQNCPECKRLERSLTVDSFIDRVSTLHNNKYDYSKVRYVNTKTKVEVICPQHGSFMITPDKHILGRGCPKCNKRPDMSSDSKDVSKSALQEQIENTNMQRYGVKRPLQSEAVRAKVRQTCLERYGVDNPAKLKSVKEKMKKTSLERYGTEWAVQSENSRKKRERTNEVRYGGASPFSAKIVRDKAKASVQEHYGVDNPAKSEVIKDKIKKTNLQKYGVEQALSSPDVIAKKEKTMLERYGGRGAMCSADVREKSRDTNVVRYGVENPAQNQDVYDKILATKFSRHSFTKSDSEDKLYELLCDRFGSDDIERQYVSEQYPFACDFYVKSLDLYIELNASWTHGHHWFGYCDDDAEKLELWKSKNTDYYNNAVRVWSEKDLQKRQTAIDNNLNYAVFWDSKLRDAVLWFAMGCPVVKADAMRLYSWLPDRTLKSNNIVLTGRSSKNISSVAKSYQFDIFYKRELKLFGSKVFKDGILLDLYLYSNRLQYLNKTPDQLSDLAILNGFSISGILKSYTTFDTALMEQVISKYDIRSVYDPCAGWGERMLCCCLHDIEYFGVDINTDLKLGYDKMISDLDMSKQNIVFEDSSEIKSMPVFRDAVITCPPYGSIEKYSEYGAENLSEDDFLEWWHKVVEKCSDFRYFCFQINQRYKEPMKNIVENAGFVLAEELVYSNNKSSHFTRKPGVNIKRESETMLVFQKST